METLERRHGTRSGPPSIRLSVRARITLPDGWNAWEGPNRFNGHALRRSNEEALEHATWYAGILVLDVSAVASRPCQDPTTGDAASRDSTPMPWSRPSADPRLPGHRDARSRPTKFGYPATHLRLRRDTHRTRRVRLQRVQDRQRSGRWRRRAEDIWVVDVDGYPILVDSQRTRRRRPRCTGSSRPSSTPSSSTSRSDRAAVEGPGTQAGKDSPFSARSRRYGVGAEPVAVLLGELVGPGEERLQADLTGRRTRSRS